MDTQSSKKNLSVRRGTQADLPRLLALIQELADYERAPDEVEVTVATLTEDGFGPNPAFQFFVGLVEDSVQGIALYYTKYSTWKGKCMYLEDLVVAESHRGCGLGRMLFDAVALEAKRANVKRMEWQVLAWNKPAIGFYKSLDAVLDPEWLNGKLVYNQLQLWEN